MTDTAPTDAEIRRSVVELLGRKPRHAVFVSELSMALQRRHGAQKQDIERAVSDLESQWAVMVRDNYCADPHVDGADLRVIGLVERDRGDEGQLEAIRQVEATWQEWLTEYMANHRCS
jgi:hypothetical protein